MVKYQGPIRNQGMYYSKFVRVEESVHVTDPDDTKTKHHTLAQEDGIVEDVFRLRNERPEEVDAGLITVWHKPEGGIITVFSLSGGFDIPTVPEARIRTGEILEELSPGYEVNAQVPEIKPSPERR